MVQFLAFSLQDQVEKYGAYVGIAAFFGLAVLTILYFSQARELKRLRDWAGRAPERAAEVEARVVAQAEAARRGQAEPVSQPAAVAAATAAAAGGGAATVASPEGTGEQATQVVEPVGASGNGTAADAEKAEEAEEAEPETPEGAVVEEDAGTEEEAEETPAAEETPSEDSSADVVTTPATSAEGSEPEPEPESEAAPEPEAEPVAGARAAGSGNGAPPPPAAGEIPVAPVPRATPLPRREPAPAAPLRQPSSSATLPPRRPAPPRRGAPVRGSAKPSSSGPSRGPLIGVGLGVLVVLVVALFATGVIGGGGDDPAAPEPNTTSSTATGTPSGDGSEETLTPEATKVAVLNGTTIPGLASTEKDKLADAGFTGEVTTGNNTDQQRADSSVLYGSRSGARNQARAVARRLDISDVRRLDADTRELGENADVVVILGQDKAP